MHTHQTQRQFGFDELDKLDDVVPTVIADMIRGEVSQLNTKNGFVIVDGEGISVIATPSINGSFEDLFDQMSPRRSVLDTLFGSLGGIQAIPVMQSVARVAEPGVSLRGRTVIISDGDTEVEFDPERHADVEAAVRELIAIERQQLESEYDLEAHGMNGDRARYSRRLDKAEAHLDGVNIGSSAVIKADFGAETARMTMVHRDLTDRFERMLRSVIATIQTIDQRDAATTLNEEQAETIVSERRQNADNASELEFLKRVEVAMVDVAPTINIRDRYARRLWEVKRDILENMRFEDRHANWAGATLHKHLMSEVADNAVDTTPRS